MSPPTVADKSRQMKYPYTLGSKIALFPWAYYFKHATMYRWYFYGMAMTLPVFLWISRKANSPENVAFWAKKREEEAKAHRH